jgi:hypothetical protein
VGAAAAVSAVTVGSDREGFKVSEFQGFEDEIQNVGDPILAVFETLKP